jgi:carbonic anhydrase
MIILMSCSKATAPINISNNTSNICDLKCEYSFNYQTTDLVGSNKGEYMSFIPNAQEPPPVTFNSDKYAVSEMRIYQPSLHTFGGVKASGELVIVHNNVTGKGTLLVCIPIKTGTTINNAATTLDTLVAQVAKLAPTSGSSAGSISLPTFTFGQLVPDKPYYNYVGSLPYSPCNGEYQYIVFSLDNAVPMTTTAFKALSAIIADNTYTTKKCAGTLYYNKNGPSKDVSGDIYIDCQPTGSSGEVLIADTSDSSNMFSNIGSVWDTLKNSGIISLILGIILMLSLIAFIGLAIKKLGTNGNGGGNTGDSGQQT